MNIPNWVTEITGKIIKDEGSFDIPKLSIRRRRNQDSSSGTCYYDRAKGIALNFGTKAPRWERKLVLIHELAHWLRPRQEGHSPEFWKLAFRLYKANGVPIRKALSREKNYKKEAVNGYRALTGKAPIKRKKRMINNIGVLLRKRYSYEGIAIDQRGNYWAVTRMTGPRRWRGFRITQGLWDRLYCKGYKRLCYQSDFEKGGEKTWKQQTIR